MKNIIFVLFISVSINISCNDFLDRRPLDAIGGDNYWKTEQDLENYVLQYYPSFPGHGTWYNGLGYREFNSDNMISNLPNQVLLGSRGITGGRWINDWSKIRSINIFFDNYQKVNAELKTYKHYLGEAHFFRAWFYFGLVNQYGDVPWYSSELKPNSNEELILPRDPRTLIVDSIIADLDHAIKYLDYRSKVGNNRINKEVALAFKSRVALFEGTWQKYHANDPFGTEGTDPNKYFQISVDAAEELITGNYTKGIYKSGGMENSYFNMFGLSNMNNVNEVLLYKAYNTEDGLSNDAQYATTSGATQMGATWSLISSYLSKSGRPYNYHNEASSVKGNEFLTKIRNEVDPRLHATIWIPGDLIVSRTNSYFGKPGIDKIETTLNPTGFQIKKGADPNSESAGLAGGGQGDTGYIIFRFAEVLLNYAEALYELKGEVAYDELNQLRDRVGMPEFFVNPQSSDPNLLDYGYPISDELYEIRRERRVELAIEGGYRTDDYRRWAAHELFVRKRPKGYPFDQNEFPEYHPPLDENGLIDYFQNSVPDGYQFKENRDYLDAIPVEELTLNPNLKQNPGW